MQTPNDDILSPDYSNPLQYFSSQSLSRTTPPIYADDPWTTSSNASFDFNDTTNSNNYAVDSSFMMESEMDHQDAGFGTELNANNVLCEYTQRYGNAERTNEHVSRSGRRRSWCLFRNLQQIKSPSWKGRHQVAADYIASSWHISVSSAKGMNNALLCELLAHEQCIRSWAWLSLLARTLLHGTNSMLI